MQALIVDLNYLIQIIDSGKLVFLNRDNRDLHSWSVENFRRRHSQAAKNWNICADADENFGQSENPNTGIRKLGLPENCENILSNMNFRVTEKPKAEIRR